MEILEAVGLLAAAFVAGAINAVAGGGSLVSFPAIVAAGYGSKVANVTNTVAVWPGYAAGTYAYREELRVQKRRMAVLSIPSVLGAIAGSIILLATPTRAFDLAAPVLIVFACVLLIFQDRLARLTAAHADGEAPITPLLMAATFVLAIYGAYFGAGLGIMLLAVLGVLLPDDLQNSNALKGFLSFVTGGVALLWFGVFGPVAWGVALLMAVGAMAGGYLGVGVARRLGRRWLKLFVVTYGLAAAAVLFITAL